jgi:hypothetical protein
MKRNLLISVILFVIGGYLLGSPENETLGSLILLGTSFWITYFLIVRPTINFAKKIFKKDLTVDKQEVSDAKHDASTDSVDLREKPPKTHVQTLNEQTHQRESEEKVDYLVPQHKLLLISVSKSLKHAEIYDAARFAWKLNVDRARNVDYVLAHQSGKVIGVFVASEWLPASDPAFNSLNAEADPARWGFVGHVAPSEILLIYFGKHISPDLRKKGASNPIRFLDNSDEADSEVDKTNTSTDAVAADQANAIVAIDIDLALENVVGRVDSDGDFSANGMLPTNQLASEGEPLFIKSKVWATNNGKELTAVNESSDELRAGDDIKLWTPYEKVDIYDGATFKLNAELDVYIIDKSESIILDPSSQGSSIELDHISVQINHSELDDDGDYRISYTVFTSAPTVAAVRFASEHDEEMQGYFREFLEPKESHDEYISGVSKDHRIKVELIKMKLAKSALSASGTGSVSVLECMDDEDFGDENYDEQLNELTIFFAALDVTDITFDDDLTPYTKKTALLTRSAQIFESIRDNVDIESRFFLKGKNGELLELTDDDSLEEALSEPEVEHILQSELLGYFCLVEGSNHWRKSFLRASESLPSTLLVCGLNTDVNAIAVQAYSEGDFDTGIVCDPDEVELYTGDAVLERFSLTEADFDISRY